MLKKNTPKGKILMDLAHHLRRLFKFGFAGMRPASPPFLTLNVTTACNMSCRHCDNDTWIDPEKDLTMAEIRKLSQELGGIEALAIGGGEPFLRKDLAEICELFVRENGARELNIPSNGFATDSVCDTIATILERCPGIKLDIALSIDGLEATHDAIRRPGSFARVMESARRIMSIQQAHPNLSLCFNATVHNANYRELPALAAFIREEFHCNLNFSILVGTPKDATLALPPEAELKETIDGINATREPSAAASDFLKIYNRVLLRSKEKGRQVVPCRAGSLIAVIYADGEVRACPELPALGNLRDQPFQEIWHSPKAKRMYRAICRGGCNCTNICFVMPSLINYWKLPFLMLNQRLKRRE